MAPVPGVGFGIVFGVINNEWPIGRLHGSALPRLPQSIRRWPGRLLDSMKALVAFSSGDRWEANCIRATNRALAPPRGEHVRPIMHGLLFRGSISNRNTPAGGITYHLKRRLFENDWIIVVKALTIFHYIFRDGNQAFVDNIARHEWSMFELKIEHRTEKMSHLDFLISYSAYLQKWLRMRACIKFPPRKTNERDLDIRGYFRNVSIETLLTRLQMIMCTLEALLDVQMDGAMASAPVSTVAFSMLQQDMTLLFVTLSEGLILLIDMEIRQDAICGDVHKRFVCLVRRAQLFYHVHALGEGQRFYDAYSSFVSELNKGS